MKEPASGAVALICLLPFLTAVNVGRPGSDDQRRVNRVDQRPIATNTETQIVKQHELVLGAGDQAVLTEQGQTITITRGPMESRRGDSPK